MMNPKTKQQTVNFPLKGKWQAVTSPGDHIPSHYTDALGMTYAFDFAKHEDTCFSLLARIKTVKIEKCSGWSEDVHSPFKAEVIKVVSNVSDRKTLNFFKDWLSSIKAFIYYKSYDHISAIFGNYVILKSDDCYCLLAHLKQNSIEIQEGDLIETNQIIGKLGHSGSAQFPHLHFQLMDSDNLIESKGIPVNFDLDKQDSHGAWENKTEYIPCRQDSIRSIN